MNRRNLAVGIAPPLAALAIAAASLVGLLGASTYAHETASNAAQAVGQDWFDLIALAPVLVIAWAWARRDPRRAPLVLGGALVFTLYTFAIYAFSVHFNALFLVYCAVLGLSSFSLAGVLARLVAEPPPDEPPVRERAAGGFLIAVGALFGALWLAEIVPALVAGRTPASVVMAGTPTNPVHVLDLSIVLPAFVMVGVALIRARPIGRVLGPILASFAVLMGLSIATLMAVMRIRGEAADLTVASAMVVVAIGSAVVLVHLVRARR